jgi:hypothetical protein
VGSNPTLSAILIENFEALIVLVSIIAPDEAESKDKGEMSERLKEHDWKSCGWFIAASRVRIPLSPP